MAIKEQIIKPPPNGWLPRTWYLVDVSFSPQNPKHRALFYTGFLQENGTPGGYNTIIAGNGGYDRPYGIHDIYTLSVVREIVNEEDAHAYPKE